MKEFLLFIVALFTKPFAKGFVLMKLWNWFIIPLQVEGWEMSYPISMGIVLITILFSSTKITKNQTKTVETIWKDMENSIFTTVIFSGIILLMGWIIKLIFM